MSILNSDPEIQKFLSGKSEHTLDLYHHFMKEFSAQGNISAEATRTMIGISNERKRIAWITQLGKNFIHVVLPFDKPSEDNLCFQKVAQVPGTNQFNHHLRILCKEDVNDEIRSYLKLALKS